MQRLKFWATWLGIGVVSLAAFGFITLMIYQHFSDGPTGPLTGGPFSTGQMTPLPTANWSKLEGDFEFELVSQGTSRTAGGILVDNELYISCDLGFIWARLPDGGAKYMLHLIWLLKDWHEKALSDGRIRIRKDGKVYSAEIELVRDTAKVEALKSALEVLAADFFKPTKLPPRPAEEPNDIWFFKVKERAAS
ncbi:MAG: hypothetical protein AAF512_01655 [Pseudomonadota bacterium]